MSTTPDQLFLGFQRSLAGHYSLEREVGRGGMGVVYLARDVALDRSVAIKLLPPILAAQPAFRERFLREARTAARLSHPHIVPIHSVAERDGFVYFVMSYVPGRTLGRRISEEGPLRPPEAARILREVAWALGYAHAQGVVHRDVKPDNILVEEPTGRALVSDFGIAQVAESDPISGGHRAGTRGFMSPEQEAGEELDGRSDLYALGLVGVYALTGRIVGEGDDAQELLAVAPGWLRTALLRCLAFEPDGRFADAGELAVALESRSVAAPEMPPALRVWLTRSRPILAGGALVSLMAAFSLAMMLPSQYVSLDDMLISLGFAVGPWIVFAAARLLETRVVLAAGYDLVDLREALGSEAARKREERAWNTQKGSPLGRVSRVMSVGMGATVVLLAIAAASDWVNIPYTILGPLAETLVLGAVGTGILGIILPGGWSDRENFWDRASRLWKSRFGDWFTKLAGVGLAKRPRAADAAHRPTEVLLGNELEDLFESLPKELRRGLEEVPRTIKRLTANAESLRAQVEAARALGEAVGRQQAQMTEAVAALETLRVGLLRLRAGTVSLEGFTTDLDAVRSVGDRVDRLVDARREVDRALPMKAANTPA